MSKPLIRTTITVPRSGVDDDGVFIPAGELTQRLRWLVSLTQQAATTIVTERWNETSMGWLAGGVDQAGNRLPAKAYAAARRLGYTARLDQVYLPDRVYRCAEEQAARTLRGAQHRAALTSLLLDTWPADPRKRTNAEWDRLRALAVERGLVLSNADVRNRTRNVTSYLKEYGALPQDIYELEDVPHVASEVILAAADKQFVTYAHIDNTVELVVKLPLIPAPRSKKEWGRVRFGMTLGPHVPSYAVLSPPTIRVTSKGIRVNVPWSTPTPARLAQTGKNHTGHARAIGADWGVNSLLTACVGTIDDNRAEHPVVRTDGRPYTFDAAGIVGKAHRLRVQSEYLTGKINKYTLLMDRTPVPYYDWVLVQKRDVLILERERVSRRRSMLNKELAWAAATWLVDLALYRDATVIYLEELTSLEAHGLGKRQNVRVSNQVRGVVLAAARHQAKKHGISVVTVPARGTSSRCSRCLAEHSHVLSPDTWSKGHSWARCKYCGHFAGRDHSAAERIVSRGLAAQHSTFADTINKIADVPVRVSRESLRKKPSRFQKLKDKDRYGGEVRGGSRHDNRAKNGPTSSQVSLRGLSVQGGLRVSLPVPVAEETNVSNVKCLTGTDCSVVSTETAQVGKVYVSVSPGSGQRSSRLRRVQGRGFHPLSYPTSVPRFRTLVTPRRVISTQLNLT